MSSKNTTEVIIGGKVFTLGGYESEEYLQKIASYINNKLAEFGKDENFRKQSAEIRANLMYLNVADDYFKEKEKNNDLQKQADDLKEQLESCKKELEEAKKEIEQLNRDIYILKDDMNMRAEEKAQVEDQLDEYFVALDASKNITSKNKNRQ